MIITSVTTPSSPCILLIISHKTNFSAERVVVHACELTNRTQGASLVICGLLLLLGRGSSADVDSRGSASAAAGLLLLGYVAV